MSRGKKNRQLPDLSMSVEEWESIKGRAASPAVGTGGVTSSAAPAAGRRPLPAGNGRGHRPLTDSQQQRYRSEWAAGIVRPHRKPWEPRGLDLADLPCICTSSRTCGLHAIELGGPRPYARG
jgi:hypothetical protein